MGRWLWRTSSAFLPIFIVAAVATAISLVSQTYQIQGTFAEFMRLWLLLSIPIVYLFRTTLGAVLFIIGAVVWLFSGSTWAGRTDSEQLLFWVYLLAIVPFYILLFRKDRFSPRTSVISICLLGATAFGLGFIADFARSDLGALSFAGLFTCAYLCGIKFFPRVDGRLSMLALLGGIGIGVTAIVLSFEDTWRFGTRQAWTITGIPYGSAIAIQLFFPIVATAIYLRDLLFRRHEILFSFAAGALPVVAGAAWLIALKNDAFSASLLFDTYALVLGIELLARGISASSAARANFGLLVVVALAIARFFDSDLSFVVRGLGFIAVGAGFILTNIYLFKRKARA